MISRFSERVQNPLMIIVAVVVVILCVWVVGTSWLDVNAAPPPMGACRTHTADACAGTVATLYEVRGANPCMVVAAQVGETRTALCIDTGFAGPCLLSLPCLALAPSLTDMSDAGVRKWCASAQTSVAASRVSTSRQEAAVHAFVRLNRCSNFTSGCTMRLASIGTTQESTSEMLLTPPLQLHTPDGKWTAPRACSGQPVAEVLTSTPMPTIHLLTCDWLVQNAPALLAPHDGVLRTNMSAAELAVEQSSLHVVSREMSGGAFVATIKVEGVDMRVTVDSGAACYLSIGKQSASKLKACRATGKTLRQVGANGEAICSHAVLADVVLGGVSDATVHSVPVLVNDMNLDTEDGYVGFCFLRHFDLCITPGVLYARRNGARFDSTLLNDTLSGDKTCTEPLPGCVRTE